MKPILMRTYVIALALGVLAFTGCRKTHDVGPQQFDNRWEEVFVYQSGMRIDSMNTQNGVNFGVVSGGNQGVFLYSYMRGMNNEMYDDEYTASVWFPVDSGATSFSYSGAQLKERRCYYTSGGAWGGYGYSTLDNGTISGTKQANGTWSVSIDITLPRKDEYTGKTKIVNTSTYEFGRYFESN